MFTARVKRAGVGRRRGVVVVQVVVLLAVMVGFAALTIDLGQLYRARAELQNAADAGALAAASAYGSDTMLKLRYGDASTAYGELNYEAFQRATAFALANYTLNDPTSIAAEDVAMGYLDLDSATSPLSPLALPTAYNAVQVTARRTDDGDGGNGPIEYFFAPLLGQNTGETSATAVAVLDDRFAGFNAAAPGAGDLLPFTLHETVFFAELTGGEDEYSYDHEVDSVYNAGDGVREVNIYPYLSAPGNFGMLNIGTPNQGTPGLADQIENGVPPEELEAEIGTTTITFVDADGGTVTYDITGNPGLTASLESSIETRIGDVIGFVLHDQVTSGGSNATYQVTQLRFGRVMDIRLQGASFQRGFWIQPVSYTGAGVVVTANAPSSGGLVGRLMLAR